MDNFSEVRDIEEFEESEKEKDSLSDIENQIETPLSSKES